MVEFGDGSDCRISVLEGTGDRVCDEVAEAVCDEVREGEGVVEVVGEAGDVLEGFVNIAKRPRPNVAAVKAATAVPAMNKNFRRFTRITLFLGKRP